MWDKKPGKLGGAQACRSVPTAQGLQECAENAWHGRSCKPFCSADGSRWPWRGPFLTAPVATGTHPAGFQRV